MPHASKLSHINLQIATSTSTVQTPLTSKSAVKKQVQNTELNLVPNIVNKIDSSILRAILILVVKFSDLIIKLALQIILTPFLKPSNPILNLPNLVNPPSTTHSGLKPEKNVTGLNFSPEKPYEKID